MALAVLRSGRCTQDEVPGGAFDEGADGGAAVAADDEVAFDVAGLGLVLHVGRAGVDGYGWVDHPGSAASVALRSAAPPAGPQAVPGRAGQSVALGLIDGLVEGLGGELAGRRTCAGSGRASSLTLLTVGRSFQGGRYVVFGEPVDGRILPGLGRRSS